MNKTLNRLIVPALLVVASIAIADSSLDGAYERVSLLNTRTGESPEAANRQGLLIMAHGHYSMMTINPERRVLGPDEQLEDMSPDEQIAYLREWLDINGHTGRYEVDGDTLVWHRDLSEDPKVVGSESRLGYELRGDLLVLSFTLPNGDRYEWTWRRVD